MVHVTIVARGFSETEIQERIEYYESFGFDVDVVRDMGGAVKGVMKTLSEM